MYGRTQLDHNIFLIYSCAVQTGEKCKTLGSPCGELKIAWTVKCPVEYTLMTTVEFSKLRNKWQSWVFFVLCRWKKVSKNVTHEGTWCQNLCAEFTNQNTGKNGISCHWYKNTGCKTIVQEYIDYLPQKTVEMYTKMRTRFIHCSMQVGAVPKSGCKLVLNASFTAKTFEFRDCKRLQMSHEIWVTAASRLIRKTTS